METKNILWMGLIITALLTALMMVDLIPGLLAAFIILPGGLGLTYYAALSRNRIEYIAEQRLQLEFSRSLIQNRDLQGVYRIASKYAMRMIPCEKVIIWKPLKEKYAREQAPDYIAAIGRWVEGKQKSLVVDEQNRVPADLELPDAVQSILAVEFRRGTNGYGVLIILNKKKLEAFSHREIEMIEELKDVCLSSMEQLLEEQEAQLYPMEIIKALVRAIEDQEADFQGHSERVAVLSRLLGERLGLDKDEIKDLYYSALLHDIGKIGGQTMESDGMEHATRGAGLLEGIGDLKRVREGIRYHHERYNGTGEPEGLAAMDIPFIARIIAVADIYDALTCLCPGEEQLSPASALQVIKKSSGSILDPLVIVALEEIETALKPQEEE
ncbi:MAG: HD domain-containing protein [Syntrophomonadaceae bacterium]|jgi:HD-GYP domain-containing protein (c-di-GMP phosphodiesterase class II)|nr:HD domain-containing protein [Syntrophomonadaceae bacterium]